MYRQLDNGSIIMHSGKRTSQNLGLQLAKEFHRQLEDILGEQIQVTLFGSQARGDATDELDIDVFVILPNLEKRTLDTALDIAWEIGLEAGKVISVIPATCEEMTLLSASPFFQAVQRESGGVSEDIFDKQELSAYRLARARETLQDAHLLTEQGGTPGSIINRAYYAMFYAVLALLTSLGKGASKHSGAIAMFDQLFVKTGELPKNMSKAIHRASDL